MSLLYCELNGQRVFDYPILDRGLAYGDGLFTTAKVIDGKVNLLAEHIKRLELSCQTIGIEYPVHTLYSRLEEIVAPHQRAVLKVIITAGEGGRGYSRCDNCSANILITVHEYPNHYELLPIKGIHLGLAETKLGINPQLAGIKHLNRLEQVLIKQELDKRVEDELLVLNYANEVVEVSAGNVFFYMPDRDIWITPELTNAGVNGIIRQQVLYQMTNATEQQMSLDDVAQASAIFVCNTIMGIIPVHTYQGASLDSSLSTSLDMSLVQQVRDKIVL